MADCKTGRGRIRAAGLKVSRRRQLEINAVYDTPSASLRRQGKLLRVRTYGSEKVLTFKGPANRGRHKRREELEVSIEDAVLMDRVLERLGLHPVFRYEKYRTEYREPAGTGMVVLDETPIGVYLEIEGEPDWIDGMAAKLGFTDAEYITASYGELYREYCRRRKLRPADMVFGSS